MRDNKLLNYVVFIISRQIIDNMVLITVRGVYMFVCITMLKYMLYWRYMKWRHWNTSSSQYMYMYSTIIHVNYAELFVPTE